MKLGMKPFQVGDVIAEGKLDCKTCGRPHKQFVTAVKDGLVAEADWADPHDGHCFRPAAVEAAVPWSRV